jgi:hypothetical protein
MMDPEPRERERETPTRVQIHTLTHLGCQTPLSFTASTAGGRSYHAAESGKQRMPVTGLIAVGKGTRYAFSDSINRIIFYPTAIRFLKPFIFI